MENTSDIMLAALLAVIQKAVDLHGEYAGRICNGSAYDVWKAKFDARDAMQEAIIAILDEHIRKGQTN